MNAFRAMFAERSNTLIPFFVLGDPDLKTSERAIEAALDGGADALELGIPFSDPIADGPTIQRAAARALKSGATVERAFELISKVKAKHDAPVGLLVYYNLIFRYGLDAFCERARLCGTDAVLSGDLSLEESTELEGALLRHELGCIHLVAPNTPLNRVKQLLIRSTAFAYVVSALGPTGARADLEAAVCKRLEQLHELADTPLVVGFGISKPEHVRAICQAGASGAIVGSALIHRMEQHLGDADAMCEEVQAFVRELKGAN